MEMDVSLSKLQADIHDALKSWHDSRADFSPLDYLQLFRQARLGGIANARRATNEILLDARRAYLSQILINL